MRVVHNGVLVFAGLVDELKDIHPFDFLLMVFTPQRSRGDGDSRSGEPQRLYTFGLVQNSKQIDGMIKPQTSVQVFHPHTYVFAVLCVSTEVCRLMKNLIKLGVFFHALAYPFSAVNTSCDVCRCLMIYDFPWSY